MIDRWDVVQCKYDARTNLSSLEWHDLRVVRRTDDCVIACDRLTVSCLTKELLAVSACVSEVLPRLPRLAVVLRPLEREHSRTWRVGHLDEDVRHVKLLQRTVRQHASASPVQYGFAAKPNIPTRPDPTRPDPTCGYTRYPCGAQIFFDAACAAQAHAACLGRCVC